VITPRETLSRAKFANVGVVIVMDFMPSGDSNPLKIFLLVSPTLTVKDNVSPEAVTTSMP